MKSYKTRGVVLHTLKYGDSGLIAYVYTEAAGRLTYMINHARSSRGKGNKGAILQPLFLVEIEGSEPRRGEMHRVKELSTSVPLSSIPFDVRKSTIALFVAEVIYRLIRETEPDERLFDFIYTSVEALDCMESGVANFHLWFLVKLSFFLGFYPGNRYSKGDNFDIVAGEFAQGKPSHNLFFDDENSELLNKIIECRVDELEQIQLSRTQRTTFLNALQSFIAYHTDSINSVRSTQILHEVF